MMIATSRILRTRFNNHDDGSETLGYPHQRKWMNMTKRICPTAVGVNIANKAVELAHNITPWDRSPRYLESV